MLFDSKQISSFTANATAERRRNISAKKIEYLVLYSNTAENFSSDDL
jgi:hypothetical protein